MKKKTFDISLTIFHKTIWSIIGIVIFSYELSAQTIIKSTPEKVSSAYSDYELIGNSPAGILVHYFGQNQSELISYDDNLKVKNRRELPYKGKDFKIESFLPTEHNLWLFYTLKENGYLYLRAKQMDNNLNIQNDYYPLDSISNAAIGNEGKTFYVKTSPDKSKILLFGVIRSRASLFVRFTVLNDSLRILSKNIFSFSDGKNPMLKSVRVNNNGYVTGVVGDVFNNFNTSDYDMERYTVYTYNPETKTIGEIPINDKDFAYKNLITETSNSRDIFYISAAYKNEQDKNDIGYIMKTIDFRTNNVLLSNTIKFTKDILQKTQTYDFNSWQDKASLFKPKRIIPRSDGGMLLITEAEYKFTKVDRNSISNNGSYGVTPYAYSVRYVDQFQFYDLMSYSINKEGIIEWQSTMAKSQISEDDDAMYSSFAFFESNTLLKFLYHEDYYNSGNFIEYNLNPNGQSKRVSLFNSDKENIAVVPKKGKQIDGFTMLLPSENKRNLQWVMLKY